MGFVSSIKNDLKKKAKFLAVPYSFLVEEILHSISHAVGFILSIVALAVLSAFASVYGNAWHVVSYSIFGGCLVLLYLVSTLYHGAHNKRLKSVLQIIDRSVIYLLIGGSYTPFTLVLRGGWGWSIFGVIWGLAILGIALTCISHRKFRVVCYSLYLIMGWLCLMIMHELYAVISSLSLFFLILGGLFYTVGFIFYSWEKLAYNHLIWHMFVIIGSILHFFAVLYLL